MVFRVLGFCTLLVSCFTRASDLSPADAGWSLAKDSEGIQVYLTDVEGSQVQAFMGKTVMDASVSSIVQVLHSDQTCADWVEGCAEAKTLNDGQFNKFYQYGVNELPWPADSRDYVILVDTQNDLETGEVAVIFTAVQGMMPRGESVRIENMQAQWYLKPVSETQTRVTWIQHTEPGGNIPEFLVNLLLLDIPFYSLSRLESLASESPYISAEFKHDAAGSVIGFNEAAQRTE